MSTSYYALKEPITSLVVKTERNHDKINVFVNHQCTGTLAVDKGQASDILSLLVSSRKVLHVWYGGPGQGQKVQIYDKAASNDTCVISDSFEITTVGEVLTGKTVVE